MKTPNKQAKYLIDKILSKHPNIQDGLKLIDFIYAKQCALITVDELIKQQEEYNNGSFYRSNYWKEVKQELINS